MKGYKLTFGRLNKKSLSENDIWKYLDILFSSKSKNQSSYKYGLIRSIIENSYSYDQNGVLSLEKLFQTFTRIYWNLVVRYGLSQTDNSHNLSAVEKVLFEIKDRHNLPGKIHFDRLNPTIQAEVYLNVFRVCKRYVLGALYGDTDGLFYAFDLKGNYIKLNPNLLLFIKKFQRVLLKLNNYEFAIFLHKNNLKKATSDLLLILEDVTKRKSLLNYKRILTKLDTDCFYCRNPFKKNSKIEVDHFIPWSYVRKDDLWNLVLACRKCNNSKRDKIPDYKMFEKLLKRNNSEEQIKTSEYSERIFVEIYTYLGKGSIT